MRYWGIKGFWADLGCMWLVFSIVYFFTYTLCGCIFGYPAEQMGKVEVTGEGDVEKVLGGDAGGNGDTKVREGEEGGAQVDEKTPLKSQIPGQMEVRYV